jgi:predicted MFS family arabinose efflux permease
MTIFVKEEAVVEKKEGQRWNENIILFILASIQFTHIMDFVIMMPMNPIFQEVFDIHNKEFGILVSSYAASAGVMSFITFFFIDRIDRKKALLWLYLGFTLGTLGCAVAQSYNFFLVARIMSGAFGGILGGLVLAIIGDVFPDARRGRATGIIMAAFSAASVLGIPFGYELALVIDWHFPFYIIAALSILIMILAYYKFPNIKGHMNQKAQNPQQLLYSIFSNANLRWSLLFSSLLMLSGFCITPYLSDYMVSNVGFDKSELKYIYLIGGSVSVITGPLIGRLADKFGKRKIFITVALISLIPIIGITSLPPVAKVVALTVNACFFIFFGGRFGPAMAMMTSSVEREKRGGFMSIGNSFQQLSSAIAAFIGGLIIGEKVAGEMVNFWLVGVFSVAVTLICILVSFRVKQVS